MNKRVSRRGFVKSLGASWALSTSGTEAECPVVPGSDLPQKGTAVGSKTPEPIAFPRGHTGRSLDRISFPLGGIGTGGIGLGGRGNLRDWQIFNRPDRGTHPSMRFPRCGFEAVLPNPTPSSSSADCSPL